MEVSLQLTGPVNPWAVGAFLFYLALLVTIGVLALRFSSAGLAEFFLAGRKLQRFVVALSAVASGRSAWLLLGMTGMAYMRGISAVWALVGYIVVELFLFLTVGRRLRQFTGRSGDLTLPDFFESRYQDRSGLLRILSVLIILVFMVAYVSAQFNAGGKAFGSSFGLGTTTGVALTAAIVLLYTLLGGFLAVSLTDVVQALFMILALIILPGVAILDFGGLKAVLTQLREIDPALVDPFAISLGGFVGFLGIGLGSPGNPHILIRYMSIDDPDQLRISAVVGTFWNVIMGWGALYAGLVGRAYFLIPQMLPKGDPENLYPSLAQVHLPPVLFGMVIASIFAAIMSTADSQLLVAASGVVRDIYQKVLAQKKKLDPRRLVLWSRVVVFLLVVAALILGVVASQLVFWLVLFAWAGLGASIGPALILSLYWKGTTKAGVAAGLVSGTLVTILWNRIPTLKGVLYELVPAFLISGFLIVCISLITRPRG